MREKLGANAVIVHCPIGCESEFKGMVDLVTMKAYLFLDETMGAKYETAEIPADLLDKCKELRQQMLEELATIDESERRLHDEGARKSRPHSPKMRSMLSIRKGVCHQQNQPRPLWNSLQKQRDSAASRCDRQLDAVSARSRHDQRDQH